MLEQALLSGVKMVIINFIANQVSHLHGLHNPKNQKNNLNYSFPYSSSLLSASSKSSSTKSPTEQFNHAKERI
jgi:hypothetical protein